MTNIQILTLITKNMPNWHEIPPDIFYENKTNFTQYGFHKKEVFIVRPNSKITTKWDPTKNHEQAIEALNEICNTTNKSSKFNIYLHEMWLLNSIGKPSDFKMSKSQFILSLSPLDICKVICRIIEIDTNTKEITEFQKNTIDNILFNKYTPSQQDYITIIEIAKKTTNFNDLHEEDQKYHIFCAIRTFMLYYKNDIRYGM